MREIDPLSKRRGSEDERRVKSGELGERKEASKEVGGSNRGRERVSSTPKGREGVQTQLPELVENRKLTCLCFLLST